MEVNKIFKEIVKKTRSISLIFLSYLFIFTSNSYATQCGYFGTYLYNGVCVPDLLVNLSNILILIGILVASILYALGTALDHTRIKEWSKDFLYQLLGTAIILSIYLVLIGILNNFAGPIYNSNLAYPGTNSVRSFSNVQWINIQQHSERHVDCLLNYTLGATKKLVKLSTSFSSLASTSIQLISSDFSNFFPLFPTGGGFTSIMSIATGALAVTTIQLRVQLEILRLAPALFSLVLPLGLLLRSFPYTRGAGAAMIAITFGFTIFLPIFYLVIEDVGYQFHKKNVCSPPPSIGFFKTIGMGFDLIRNDAMTFVEKYFGIGGDFEEVVIILVVQATILPFAAYLVVLNIIKRLAELFGGEIDFSTLVRLI